MSEQATARLPEPEYVERFTAHVLKRCAGRTHFDGGLSIEAYARETAATYWRDQYAEDADCGQEEMADEEIWLWED